MVERRALETLVSFWHGRRIFLTGHTGFKGSWLALRLSDLGASVSGYALAPSEAPAAYDLLGIGDLIASTFGDIRDRSLLEHSMQLARPEIVMHLAAQPLVRRSYREPVETFETNVMGTVHVLEAARKQKTVGAVLIVTSDKTYVNREARAHREDDPLGGDDPYSASKACAEIVAGAYRRSFFAEGPWLATARAGNVIGGGDFNEDRLVPDIVRASLQRKPLVLRYPNAVRPWQFVGDALEGYLQIVERMHADPSIARGWNFGPAEHERITVGELARRFLDAYDPSTEIVVDSRFAPPESAYLALDSRAAREVLAWQPRYDATAAVDATAAWYRGWKHGVNLRDLTLSQMRGPAARIP